MWWFNNKSISIFNSWHEEVWLFSLHELERRDWFSQDLNYVDRIEFLGSILLKLYLTSLDSLVAGLKP